MCMVSAVAGVDVPDRPHVYQYGVGSYMMTVLRVLATAVA
jgi:hypothetical protein